MNLTGCDACGARILGRYIGVRGLRSSALMVRVVALNDVGDGRVVEAHSTLRETGVVEDSTFCTVRCLVAFASKKLKVVLSEMPNEMDASTARKELPS